MTHDEIVALVTQYTARVMKVDLEQVRPETDLREDLEADSLDVAELNVLLEENLGLSIGEEKFKDLSTVGDIAEMVQRHVGAAA